MLKTIGSILLASTLFACTTGTENYAAPAESKAGPDMEGSKEDIAAVLQVFTDWGAAREAGDIDAVVALHHPDMLIMARNKSVLRGHQGVRDFYAQNYSADSTREMLNAVNEVRVLGDVAVVTGRFLVIDTPNNIEDPGYYLILLRKNNDGVWEIYRDIDTPSPDALSLKNAPE